jgi:hypothetical protein
MKKLFLAAAIAASLTACYSNGPSTERSARPNAPTGTPDQPTTLATTLRYAPGTAAARAGDDADPGHQGPSYPWHADGIDSRLARNADNYLLCARAGAAEACAIVTPLGYMDGLEMQTDVGTDGSTALLTFQPASGGHGFSDDDNGRIDAFNKRLATVAAQLSGQLAPRLRSAHPGGSARGLSDDGNDEPDTDSDPAAADDAGNNIPMVNVPGNLPDPGGLPPDPDIPVVEVPGQRPPPPEPPYGSGSASFGEPSLRSQNCVAFWMPGMPTPAQS